MENHNLQKHTLLQGKNIWKSFGDISVLKSIDIHIKPHQIMALLGANGAGKSTLVKILVGLVSADQGELAIEGKDIGKNITPHMAMEAGICLVPQEPLLFPNMSIFDNITLTMKESRIILRQKCEDLLKKFHSNLDLDMKAAHLKVADQQLIQIFRGIIRDAKVIIFDEPTSALTSHETGSLFSFIKQLAENGMGIVFISHRLWELYEICHDIIVLKDGKIVLQGALDKYTQDDLIVSMTGEKSETYLRGDNKSNQLVVQDEPILSTDKLCGEDFKNISLHLNKGEVVGLTGIVGSGRTEFAEALIGIKNITSGNFSIKGQYFDSKAPRDINILQEYGLAYLPEDRQVHGLFLDSSILVNLLSGVMKKLPFFINSNFETRTMNEYKEMLDIVYSSSAQHIKRLSGGNQQKILLAKWLLTRPNVLILDEPTRGVDVKSRNEIYRIINELSREHNLSILMISSDYEEIITTCDRCYIMRFGEICAHLEGDTLNLDTINTHSWGNVEHEEQLV